MSEFIMQCTTDMDGTDCYVRTGVLIRCKDCKHKNVYRFPPKYDARDYCEKQGKVVDVADFCSWAERREE